MDLPPAKIGETGVIVGAVAHPPFRRRAAAAGVEPLGFGAEFRGVFVGEAQVFLPDSWGGRAAGQVHRDARVPGRGDRLDGPPRARRGRRHEL